MAIGEKIKTNNKEQQAYAFFLSKGWTPEQASGIVGNLMHESGLNPTIEGDIGLKGGSSRGLAQFRGERLQRLKSRYGSNWTNFDNQLDFVNWELNNTHKSAGDALRRANNPYDAGRIVSDKYEIPAVKFNANKDRQQKVLNTYNKLSGSNFEYAPGQRGGVDATAVEEEKPLPTIFMPNYGTPGSISGIAGEDTEEEKAAKEEIAKVTEQQQMMEEYVNQQAQAQSQLESQQARIAQQETQQAQPFSSIGEQYAQVAQFVDTPLAQQGGFIKDNRGQWAHPGQLTEIASPHITMDGVSYPVLGISKETGEQKVMMPNLEYYFDKTKNVLEIPLMQGGGIYAPTLEQTLNPQFLGSINPVTGMVNNELPAGSTSGMGIQLPEIIIPARKKEKSQIEKNKDIQNKLISLGYDIGSRTGEADGIIGKKTLAALAEYKKTGKSPKNISLVGEELLARRAKPKISASEQIVNYIDDNVAQYITNPLKGAASAIAPEPLKYKPELSTVGTYDETKGAKKYLMDTKSIEDIRKEKNISFAQITKNRGEANAILPLSLKERIVNATNPQGYMPDVELNDNFISRVLDEKSKTQQVKRLEGKKGDFREDIYRMYSGLPQKFDSFTASSFKAGKDSDTNLTFKNPEDVADYIKIAAAKTDLFQKLASGQITPESIAKDKASGKKGAQKINKASFRDPKNVMWNATMGVDFDKSGQPYLSFYDNWDLAMKDDNVVTKAGFGAPMEIYDRIPLTKGLIDEMAKITPTMDSNEESDNLKDAKKQDKSSDAALSKISDMIRSNPRLREEYNTVLTHIKKRYK